MKAEMHTRCNANTAAYYVYMLYVTPNLQKKHLNFVLRLHFRYPDWHDRGTRFDALVVSDSDTQLGNDNI